MNFDIRQEDDPVKRAILGCWLVQQQAETFKSIDRTFEAGRAMEIAADTIRVAIAGWEYMGSVHRAMFKDLPIRFGPDQRLEGEGPAPAPSKEGG